MIVRKSDGGFMYSTTDLAAVRQRVSDEGADRVLYVTDSGQATHFEQVRAARPLPLSHTRPLPPSLPHCARAPQHGG